MLCDVWRVVERLLFEDCLFEEFERLMEELNEICDICYCMFDLEWMCGLLCVCCFEGVMVCWCERMMFWE